MKMARVSRKVRPCRLPGAILAAAMIVAPSMAVAQTAGTEGRIIVGPNVRVSHNPWAPFVEHTVAVDPTDSGRLLGAAIAFTGPGGHAMSLPFRSPDGGVTWLPAPLPEQVAAGGADPQVGFGPDGTAYFVALSAPTIEDAGLEVYRSDDGGVHWTRPVRIVGTYDHPQLAVDVTEGPHRGNLYMGTLTVEVVDEEPRYRIMVLRSVDGGRTWEEPVPAVSGDGRGVNVEHVLVDADGTLLVTYMRFDRAAARDSALESSYGLVVSTDGGRTFSDPREGISRTTPGRRQLRRMSRDRPM